MSDTEPATLTRQQAESARDVVIGHFRAYCYDQDAQLLPAECLPRLYEPGHNGSGWDLTWEGYGPHDWPRLASGGGYDDLGNLTAPATFPPGVRAEPINGCELGLYPHPD